MELFLSFLVDNMILVRCTKMYSMAKLYLIDCKTGRIVYAVLGVARAFGRGEKTTPNDGNTSGWCAIMWMWTRISVLITLFLLLSPNIRPEIC